MKKLSKTVVLLLSVIFLLTSCGNDKITTSSVSSNKPESSDENVTSEIESNDDSSLPESSLSEDSTDSSEIKEPDDGNSSLSSKEMSTAQGNGYLILSPLTDHPGVAEMDAEYTFSCSDKLGNIINADDFELSCEDKSVKINGNTVTIPWKTRSEKNSVTVTARIKDKPIRTGSYTFEFWKYTADPTFFDDFNSFDSKIWERADETDRIGTVENGNLVFTVLGENEERYEIITTEFKQAYGCFSARIDMPDNGNANAAFWMMTTDGDRYIKNPAMPSQSNGEIDVVEYFATWGDRWSAALHWFAWNPNYINSWGDEYQPGAGIRDGYHIFSVVWTTEGLYWYYDGKLSIAYTGDGVAPDSGPMALLLQLKPYYSDGWGGAYDPTDYPYTMKTDWVRVFAFEGRR